MERSKKLKYLRESRGITQQALANDTGISLRLIQKYEEGSRSPKEDNLNRLAEVLNVSPLALSEPNFDTYAGVIQALFRLEEEYGLTLALKEFEISIQFEDDQISSYLASWQKEKKKLIDGDISNKEYEIWKASFPMIKAERDADRFNRLYRELKKQKKD